MTESTKHLLALAAVLAALVLGVGCGGGSDESTVPPESASAQSGSVGTNEAQKTSEKKPSRSSAVDNGSGPSHSHPQTSKKAAVKHERSSDRSGRSAHRRRSAEDAERRIEELAQGAGGVQVVSSHRAIEKIIHKIQDRVRQKNSHEDSPGEGAVAEVLEKLGG